ncbi:MAG: response regulator [Candidatus Electrothrix sp. AR4]|nr:response regulator [Candidatus Electrothrix sp. AR4]
MKQQVLIVDDDPELLLSINSGFENNDRFHLLTAENGREALDILDSNKLDLVVTDLRMPVMDGVELLAIMSESFSEVPNIVMTAFGTSVMEKQLKKAGSLNILEKPIDIDELEEAINKALDIQEEQNCSLAGLPLSSFLQLVAVEQKTVHLKIFHLAGQCGSLFFHDGDLVDAEYNDLIGDEAVLEMLEWENARVSIKEFSGPFPKSRMKSELLSLIFTALQRQDWNPDDTEHPLEMVKKEFNRIKRTAPRQAVYRPRVPPKKTKKTSGIKALLKQMADEMDGVLAIQVTGMDGITIALHNPSGTNIEVFSAKFAMILKLVEKSIHSLKEMGDFEENLVQSHNAWVLTRLITPQYYVGIAVNREGTLGNVRLVTQRYIGKLRKEF